MARFCARTLKICVDRWKQTPSSAYPVQCEGNEQACSWGLTMANVRGKLEARVGLGRSCFFSFFLLFFSLPQLSNMKGTPNLRKGWRREGKIYLRRHVNLFKAVNLQHIWIHKKIHESCEIPASQALSGGARLPWTWRGRAENSGEVLPWGHIHHRHRGPCRWEGKLETEGNQMARSHCPYTLSTSQEASRPDRPPAQALKENIHRCSDKQGGASRWIYPYC